MKCWVVFYNPEVCTPGICFTFSLYLYSDHSILFSFIESAELVTHEAIYLSRQSLVSSAVFKDTIPL